MFASRAYTALPAVVLVFLASRWLTKKDPKFMSIFLRYMDEHHAYSSLPRPDDWMNRPVGWGRGLPW